MQEEKKLVEVVNEKTSALYLEFLKSFSHFCSDEIYSNLNQNKICYEDLTGLLYLRYRIIGYYDYNRIRQVVIDEAQDYGEFFYATLKKIMKNATFSIFGDLAQTIYRYRKIETWDKLTKLGYCDNLKILSKSYRTTIEIMEEANKINEYLGLTRSEAVVRHGKKIAYVKNGNILELVNNLLETGYETIAIISKNEEDAKIIYEELKKEIDITLITDKSNEYRGGICSITSSLSKDLEFDSIIINKVDSDIFDIHNPYDMKLLYVSMTRALHEEIIVYQNELVDVLK